MGLKIKYHAQFTVYVKHCTSYHSGFCLTPCVNIWDNTLSCFSCCESTQHLPSVKHLHFVVSALSQSREDGSPLGVPAEFQFGLVTKFYLHHFVISVWLFVSEHVHMFTHTTL